jgi:hypothetical protein
MLARLIEGARSITSFLRRSPELFRAIRPNLLADRLPLPNDVEGEQTV